MWILSMENLQIRITCQWETCHIAFIAARGLENIFRHWFPFLISPILVSVNVRTQKIASVTMWRRMSMSWFFTHCLCIWKFDRHIKVPSTEKVKRPAKLLPNRMSLRNENRHEHTMKSWSRIQQILLVITEGGGNDIGSIEFVWYIKYLVIQTDIYF